MRLGCLDNDVLFKAVCYGLVGPVLEAIPAAPSDAHILKAAEYIIRNSLRRLKRTDAEPGLDEWLARLKIVEPHTSEIQLAAEIEYLASQEGLNLDAGESLLCAIVVLRQFEWMATGDKRAIVALGSLISSRSELRYLLGRIVCLEQIFLRLLDIRSPKEIRELVCAQPSTDKALSVCFGCRSEAADEASWRAGLASYIDHLRLGAGGIVG